MKLLGLRKLRNCLRRRFEVYGFELSFEEGGKKEMHDIKKDFQDLVLIWKDETHHLCFTSDKVKHWAYKEIIALGVGVLSYLFEKMRDGKDDWHEAAEKIIGFVPDRVKSARSNSEISWAWRQWWKMSKDTYLKQPASIEESSKQDWKKYALTVDQVAEHLQKTGFLILNALELGQLRGFYENSVWKLPKYQFDFNGTLPGIMDLHSRIPLEVSVEKIYEFMMTEYSELQDRTPENILLHHYNGKNFELVVKLAKEYFGETK